MHDTSKDYATMLGLTQRDIVAGDVAVQRMLRGQGIQNPTEDRPETPNVDVQLDPDLPAMNRKQRRRYIASVKKNVRAQLREMARSKRK